MAKFTITKTTTAADLKEQYANEVGGVLRVYDGRSEAPADATLVSLGAKEGVLECRTSRTVGKFEKAFQDELNLKVKVYTKYANGIKVLDGITLAVAAKLPGQMTKADMEAYLSYQRDEVATAEAGEEVVAEAEPEAEPEKKIYGKVSDEVLNSWKTRFYDGLSTVKIDDKYGYFDEEGNIVIEPKFDGASDFWAGVAQVMLNDKWGVIDTKGNIVVEPKFDYIEGQDPIVVKVNNKWGVYDKTGKVLFEPIFKNKLRFDDVISLVNLDDKYGFIDKFGNYVVEPKFDDADNSDPDNEFVWVEVNGKFGLIDKQGNLVLEPIYKKVLSSSNFPQNLLAVKTEKGWGLIDRQGNFVLEPKFGYINPLSEGRMAVQLDYEWGYMDENLNMVIKPQFEDAEDFYEGKAEVKIYLEDKDDYDRFKIDLNGNRVD